MKNKILILSAMVSALLLSLSLAGCKTSGFDLNSMTSAGHSVLTAATLSDADVKALGDRTIAEQDGQNRVAADNSNYAKRLDKLTSGWRNVDGTTLEFKVYVKEEINAFAVPNGSIRIYSGLMDKMTDEELRYVIGHEIGHVILGHSKSAMQMAYTTAAARDVAAASNNSIAVSLSSSQLGVLAESLLNAQFSQKQENDADDFAIGFLKSRNLNATAAVTALRKLETESGNNRSVFSSHPAPGDRAARLEKMISAR